MPTPRPRGTVTFVFTDIEASTRLTAANPVGMRAAQARHDQIVASACAQHGGHLFRAAGDGFCMAFQRAADGVAAAVEMQLSLEAAALEPPVRIRIGVHLGDADCVEGDYQGLTLNRVARIMEAGHGGQTLLSEAVADATGGLLPVGCELVDLGVHRLRDFERGERLYQLNCAGLASTFPALRGLESFPNNLPQQATTFIGREEIIEEIHRILGTTRLLTLTGGGGAGKSRLSIRIAGDLIRQHPDGVWFVELAALTEDAQVARAVAEALGLRETSSLSTAQQVAAYLRQRQALIVLDNCEHLVKACADFATLLLQSCPNVKLLATSREVLGIRGETALRVPPLTFPTQEEQRSGLADPSSYEAIRLFVDRACSSSPAFALDEGNAASISEVVRRLDGIPLAIELAAARIRTLYAHEIAARLDDRFRLLTGGDRSALPRQQTLRALIDWSYDLLDERERMMLRRLGVFAGPFDMDAAERVCADAEIDAYEVLDLISRLVDKSLVVSETSARGSRYRLLETVREYAREMLAGAGEDFVACERRLEFVSHITVGTAHEQLGPSQKAWSDRISLNHETIVATLRWCFENDRAQQGLRIACALSRFWEIRGNIPEGVAWLKLGLERTEGGSDRLLRARALKSLAMLAQQSHRLEETARLLDEALQIIDEVGDDDELSQPLFYRALTAHDLGDLDASERFAERCVVVSERVGSAAVAAAAFNVLGLVAIQRGNFDAAEREFREGLRRWRGCGHRRGEAIALQNLAQVAFRRGEPGELRRLAEESYRIVLELSDLRTEAECLRNLAMADYLQGDHAGFVSWLDRLLFLERRLGFGYNLLFFLEDLADRVWQEGNHAFAATILGATESEAAEYAHYGQYPDRPIVKPGLDAIRRALDDAELRAAYDRGRAMAAEEAVAAVKSLFPPERPA